ncbi:hypothetical protein D3C76_850500 [compost metagenome]
MEGIRIVFAVNYTRNCSISYPVALGELAGQPFGRGSEQCNVQIVAFTLIVAIGAHVRDQIIGFVINIFILAVMLAVHRLHTFSKSDKSDGETAVLKQIAYGILRS